MLSSGSLPYQYDIPYPFKITADNPNISMSGIIFEQCMWVATAELRRFSASESNRVQFQLYQHQDGLPGLGDYESPAGSRTNYKFEPTITGRVLANSGQIHAVEWITDLRAALSGIPSKTGVFGRHGTDAGIDSNSYLGVWLRAKLGTTLAGTASIQGANYQHFFEGTTWGPSGSLYDIDVNEIQFQPITRFTKIQTSIFPNRQPISSPIVYVSTPVALIEVTGPIFPSFAKTNGGAITLSTEDQLVGDGYNDLSYTSIGSGYWKVKGDVLKNDGIYQIGGINGTFFTNGIRNLGGSVIAQTPFSKAFITVPSHTKGSYNAIVYNNNIFPPSGEIVSEWPGAGNAVSGIGFEYFDDCMASRTATYFFDDNTVAGQPSGGYFLIGPYSGRKLFIRWEPNHPPILNKPERDDGTPITSSLLCAHRTNTTNIRGMRTNSSTVASATFDEFSNLFVNTSNFTHTLAATAGPTDLFDFHLTGTSLYILASNKIHKVTEGDYINASAWTWDSAGSSSILADTSVGAAIFDSAGTIWVTASTTSESSPRGFAAVSFGALTGNLGTFTIGTMFDLDASSFGYTTEVPRSIEVVSNATTVTNGIWCVFTATNIITGAIPALLGRIELSGSTWTVVELYGYPNKYEGALAGNSRIFSPHFTFLVAI